MRRKGMEPEDIASVLDKTKLRNFVGKAVAEQIEALGEDMDAEEYATRVAELTAPAREQRSAAGACPARAQATRPTRRRRRRHPRAPPPASASPSPRPRTHTHTHTRAPAHCLHPLTPRCVFSRAPLPRPRRRRRCPRAPLASRAH